MCFESSLSIHRRRGDNDDLYSDEEEYVDEEDEYYEVIVRSNRCFSLSLALSIFHTRIHFTPEA